MEEKWDSLVRQIGKLEDEEEAILEKEVGKEAAEEFLERKKIDPNWDDETKRKINELEKQVELLSKGLDTLVSPHPRKNRIKRFLKNILEAKDLSLLASGPDQAIHNIFREGGFELGYDEIIMVLQEVLNETGDSELETLLEILPEKRVAIEKWLEERRDARKRQEKSRDLSDQMRQEIPRAKITSNSELEGKPIQVLSSNGDWVLCSIVGNEAKYKFKPTWHQKQQLLSMAISGVFPCRTRIIRTPKKGFFVFERTWNRQNEFRSERYEQ